MTDIREIEIPLLPANTLTRPAQAMDLRRGDCLEVMRGMAAGRVDLIVTSPPYNIRNTTGGGMNNGGTGKWQPDLSRGYDGHSDDMPHEEYVSWQRACLDEMLRLIPDNGAIFYNHKWRVQDGLMQDRQDIVGHYPVRQIIIWKRSGGINFNPCFFVPTYEVIYLIAKKDFRLAPKANGVGDVWTFPAETNNDHPAPFPLALPYRCISSTSAKVVLDPFMGSGTTGLAARQLNRNFIGIEQSQTYFEMAQKRLSVEVVQRSLWGDAL
jgi:site-specific DNA-methyltransferase (adenine-specific)